MEQSVNPYPGPEPFSTPDPTTPTCTFYGRDAEKARLGYIVLANPISLLYASSGAGKTSLVNAGLIPWLQNAGTTVTVSHRMRQELAPDANIALLDNIFVALAIKSLKNGYSTSIKSQNNASIMTVSEVNELAHQTLEAYIQTLFKPSAKAEEVRVLVFDQFEDIFEIHKASWQKRQAFFEQMAKALTNFPQLHVLLVMREEYLARINLYARYLPSRFEVKYYLEPLRKEEAFHAVQEPSKVFTEDAARWICDKLTEETIRNEDGEVVTYEGEYVDTTNLQVICHTLWDIATKNGFKIDKTWLEAQNKDNKLVTEMLATYYMEQIQNARAKGNPLLKVEEIVEWMQLELIDRGLRKMSIWNKNSSPKVDESTLQALIDSRLVHLCNSSPSQKVIELAHDRIVSVVNAVYEKSLRSVLAWKLARDEGNYFINSSVYAFIEKLAYYISRDEKRKRIPEIDDLINQYSDPELDRQAYFAAEAQFSLAVLDGEVPFEKLYPETYTVFLQSLFQHAKALRAYFIWQQSIKEGMPEHGFDRKNFIAACERTRIRSYGDKNKLSLQQFIPIRDYIRKELLDRDGRCTFIEEKPSKWIPHSAWVWDSNYRKHLNVEDGFKSKANCQVFYENIIPAVESESPTHLTMIGTAMAYEPIDCFQAVIAMHFLKPRFLQEYRIFG